MSYIHSFIEHIKSLNYAEATLKIRQSTIEKFQKWNTKELKDITEQDIREFLQLKERSVNTQNTYLISLRQFFQYLEQEFIIFCNPAREILCVRDKKLPQVISPEQVTNLLNFIDINSREGKRHKAVFEILYSTGVRRGELLNLKLADIDLNNSTLKILGKGQKERFVPLGKTARQALKNYLNKGRPESTNEYVFLTINGLQLSCRALESTVNILKEKTGINFSCHTLRRSCATHLLNNGASPLVISELLGHADLKTLSQYLRVNLSEIKEMHHQTPLGQ